MVLLGVVIGSKKGFCRHISSKSKTREKVDSLLNGVGYLVTKNMEKSGVFNAFFTLIFTGKTTLLKTHVPKTSVKVWSKKNLPSVKNNQVKEH